MQEQTLSKTLPISMAVEMRDFLIYALWDYAEGEKP